MSKTASRLFRLNAIEQCYAWPNGTSSGAKMVNYGHLTAEDILDADSAEWGRCADEFGILFPPDVQPRLGTKYVVTIEEVES